MAPHDPSVLKGDLEFAVLAELWSSSPGGATIRELYDRIGKPRGIVYTTVAKVVDRLAEKDAVKRRRVGRSYVYSALAQRAETQRAMVRDVIARLAGGDPEPAIAALIGAMEDVSPELLEQLAAELRARKRKS